MSPDGDLSACAQPQFVPNVLDVSIGGPGGHHEARRNLEIRQAFGDERRNLHFAGSQKRRAI
jgi:hypothetical protein